jgi:RNase P/RNase MRP subunit POP5
MHEYLHALGELSEDEVKRLVVRVAKKCFGEEHIAATIARKSPWVLLKDLPVGTINAPKCVMAIVKELEKTDRYIV